jgi:hypothetical protein
VDRLVDVEGGLIFSLGTGLRIPVLSRCSMKELEVETGGEAFLGSFCAGGGVEEDWKRGSGTIRGASQGLI